MDARIVIGSLALVFVILAATRIARDGGRVSIAARTWLTIGLIFGAVSVWSWVAARR
jgi:hypothetical protein